MDALALWGTSTTIDDTGSESAGVSESSFHLVGALQRAQTRARAVETRLCSQETLLYRGINRSLHAYTSNRHRHRHRHRQHNPLTQTSTGTVIVDSTYSISPPPSPSPSPSSSPSPSPSPSPSLTPTLMHGVPASITDSSNLTQCHSAHTVSSVGNLSDSERALIEFEAVAAFAAPLVLSSMGYDPHPRALGEDARICMLKSTVRQVVDAMHTTSSVPPTPTLTPTPTLPPLSVEHDQKSVSVLEAHQNISANLDASDLGDFSEVQWSPTALSVAPAPAPAPAPTAVPASVPSSTSLSRIPRRQSAPYGLSTMDGSNGSSSSNKSATTLHAYHMTKHSFSNTQVNDMSPEELLEQRRILTTFLRQLRQSADLPTAYAVETEHDDEKRPLSYQELSEGCVLLYKTFTEVKEKLRIYQGSGLVSTSSVRPSLSQSDTASVRRLQSTTIILRGKLEEANQLIASLERAQKHRDASTIELEMRLQEAEATAAKYKNLLFQNDWRSFFQRNTIMYLIHIVLGGALILSSWWRKWHFPSIFAVRRGLRRR
jgi:hypothetical protein